MTKDRKVIMVTIFSFLSLAVFAAVLINATLYSPFSEPSQSFAEEALANEDSSSHPSKIYIPALNIDAKVTNVGITLKGNMATPRSFKDVGWYKYGTVPGEEGSSVMAGHVDNGLAFPGVFSNLKNIKIGDDIYVTNEEEKTLHFKVTKIDTLDFNAKAEEVFKENGAKLLKLITCVGVWIDEYRTHDQRLIVTSVLVSDT